MANINLLPWRDAQRRERNRETLIMCAIMWALACCVVFAAKLYMDCLLYTSPSPRDKRQSRMPSSA